MSPKETEEIERLLRSWFLLTQSSNLESYLLGLILAAISSSPEDFRQYLSLAIEKLMEQEEEYF